MSTKGFDRDKIIGLLTEMGRRLSTKGVAGRPTVHPPKLASRSTSPPYQSLKLWADNLSVVPYPSETAGMGSGALLSKDA